MADATKWTPYALGGGFGLGLAGIGGSMLAGQPQGFNQGIGYLEDYLRQLQGRYGEVEARTFNPLTDPGVRGARGEMQSQLAQARTQTARTLAQRGLSQTGLAGALDRQSALAAGRAMGQVTSQRATSFEQWKDQLMQSLLGQIGSTTGTLASLYGQQAQMESMNSPWSALAGLGGTLASAAIMA